MSASSLSDQINQAVSRATREDLDMDDWDSIILLCDLLAQKPDEASPVVIKAVIDRLRNDNPKIQRLALTLLDSCVKNAGDYFHKNLCLPRNLIIIEKLAKSDDVGHRVREIVTEWSREFGVRMPEFHRSLARISGEESPLKIEPTDTAAPSTSTRSRAYYENLTQQPQRLEQRFEDPIEKIRADMDVVRETTKTLRGIVVEASSADDIKDRSCVQVVVNCREMHRRLIELIESEPEERLLLELIDLNDELYNAIEEHDHFKRTGTKKQMPKDKARQGNGRSDTGTRQEEENLFSLVTGQDAGSSAAVQVSSTASKPATDLDMFLFGSPAPEASTSTSVTSQPSSSIHGQQQQQQHSDLPVDPFASLLISPPPPPQQQQQQQQQQQNNSVNDNINPFF